MDYKKSKWEVEYDNYKTGKDAIKTDMAKIRRELAELKEGSEYGAKKSELEALKKKEQKYSRIEKNTTKIENLLGLKRELVTRTSELLDKRGKIVEAEQSLAKCDKAIKVLDLDKQKKLDEVKKIDVKLKTAKLSDEEKAKLAEQKQTLLKGVMENDQKYSQVANTKDQIAKTLESYDADKIKEELLKNEQLIGKCDLIGANLIKGKSMDEISAKLENFTFTPNKDFAGKIQAMRKMYDKEKSKPEEVKEDKDKMDEALKKLDIKNNGSGTKEQTTKEGGEDKVKVSEGTDNVPKEIGRFEKFLQKHPRLAKVKELFDKVKNKFTKNKVEEKIEQEKPAEEEKPVKAEEPEKVDKTNEDFEYAMKHLDGKNQNEVLKAITEKGTGGFKESIKVEKQEMYKKMKQKAAEDYAKKYAKKHGSRYDHQDGMEK